MNTWHGARADKAAMGLADIKEMAMSKIESVKAAMWTEVIHTRRAVTAHMRANAAPAPCTDALSLACTPARLFVLASHSLTLLSVQAVPEQQKLTVQLVRNSIYFVASIVLIQYGEVIAI